MTYRKIKIISRTNLSNPTFKKIKDQIEISFILVDENKVFNEKEQEILIDPKNFEFNLKYTKTYYSNDGKKITRLNYLAIPK